MRAFRLPGLQMPTHRGRALDCHEQCRTTSVQVDSAGEWLRRVRAVRVAGRRGPQWSDRGRARPIHVHGATAFETEEGETRDLSLRTVPSLAASSYDPTPIVRAPCISRGAATTSDVARGRCESV